MHSPCHTVLTVSTDSTTPALHSPLNRTADISSWWGREEQRQMQGALNTTVILFTQLSWAYVYRYCRKQQQRTACGTQKKTCLPTA